MVPTFSKKKFVFFTFVISFMTLVSYWNDLCLHCYFLCNIEVLGARIAHWLKRRTRDRKVVSSSPGRSGGRNFFSRVNFVCWLLFSVCFTPVLPQWHIKDPGHSAKSADSRLHLNTYTPLTQWSRSGLTMPLSNIVGEPIRKRAHMQFIRECSVTVILARWATVDWFWPKEWNKCAWANFQF